MLTKREIPILYYTCIMRLRCICIYSVQTHTHSQCFTYIVCQHLFCHLATGFCSRPSTRQGHSGPRTNLTQLQTFFHFANQRCAFPAPHSSPPIRRRPCDHGLFVFPPTFFLKRLRLKVVHLHPFDLLFNVFRRHKGGYRALLGARYCRLQCRQTKRIGFLQVCFRVLPARFQRF